MKWLNALYASVPLSGMQILLMPVQFCTLAKQAIHFKYLINILLILINGVHTVHAKLETQSLLREL